jgi:hypothetical protein
MKKYFNLISAKFPQLQGAPVSVHRYTVTDNALLTTAADQLGRPRLHN